MANITEPRDPARRAPDSDFHDPVAASLKLIKGAMYGLDASGNAIKMETGAAISHVRGEVIATVDNSSGDAGDKKVRGRGGMFTFHVTGTLDRTDIGNVVYALDDQTVSRDSDEGARPIMGLLLDITAAGKAVVLVGMPGSSKGLNSGEVSFVFFVDDLVGTDVYGFVAPFAFNITKVKSVLLGAALTTGNATLTSRINTTAVTGAVLTITQAGSAVLDVDTAAATGASAVAENDVVNVIVGGTNDAAGARAMVTVCGVRA
jgi:hypothetical protein